MKRAFLILVLTGVIVTSINAQVKMGLMGGMNFSSAYQRQFFFSGAEFKTKLIIGGIVDLKLTDIFRFVLNRFTLKRDRNAKVFLPAESLPMFR